MKIIEKRNNRKVWFKEFGLAQAYMLPPYDLYEDAYVGDDYEAYSKKFKEYKRELIEAESLEELAKVWNKYTDILEDGSEFIVKEI